MENKIDLLYSKAFKANVNYVDYVKNILKDNYFDITDCDYDKHVIKAVKNSLKVEINLSYIITIIKSNNNFYDSILKGVGAGDEDAEKQIINFLLNND